MRNLRFAHKQENHSRRQVFEKIQLYSFPITNKQVNAFIKKLILILIVLFINVFLLLHLLEMKKIYKSYLKTFLSLNFYYCFIIQTFILVNFRLHVNSFVSSSYIVNVSGYRIVIQVCFNFIK